MGARVENKPAFQGASFDKKGFCIVHPTCQLVDPMKDENGKVCYEELKRCCPNCVSEKNKLKKGTSLGGGKVREGRTHGTPAREPSSRQRSASRGRGGRKPRKEYDTPFDDKGRCHYHRNVQLASKKMGGGWKVLHKACPKCIEETHDDDRSVKSSSSKKSNAGKKSSSMSKLESQLEGVNARGQQHDANGCCSKHSHIQVAKKKMLGKWKVVRVCPACSGDDVGLDDDRMSVASKSSRRSTSSRKSCRSNKGKPGQAAKSSRYGSLPFDGDGYCCRHPSVQIAQKKMMGGWKIIHDVCPECNNEGGGPTSKRAPRRKSSAGGSSRGSRAPADTESNKSGSAASSSKKKKRIRVKNLKTEDEHGKPGKYSGYVNDEYR
mmetsp:Transcript_11171/g.22748  ORF Transcript_11171/g.22748 Transcript_11171/m.22748 type:complete len:378 (+) Transcript_11171:176-1309(+)